MRKEICLALAAFLALAVAVYAWTPPGNIDLQNYYSLIKGVWVNSSKFYASGYYYGNGSMLTDITGKGNTTTEIKAAVNTTEKYQFTAQNSTQVYNATYDAKPSNTYNATYNAYVVANISNSTRYLNNYQSSYFYPINKTMSNATIFGDNLKLYFGTDSDVAMYFNGSHLVIEKV